MALYALLKRLFGETNFDMDYIWHESIGHVATYMQQLMFRSITKSVGRRL